jgi:hypothetical protein
VQLITGGLGFIGMHTARALLDQGESCVLVTRSGAIREPDFIRDEIGKRIFIEHLEVSNLSAVLELGKRYAITGIVHLSGASPGRRDRPHAAENLHKMPTGFVHKGYPTGSGLPPWPRYDLKHRATMSIDVECRVLEDPDPSLRELWESL